MLAAAYTFDAVESDHQLKFKKRGRTPSRAIAEQDLVPVNAEREAFIETRAQEVDLPLRFTVNYQGRCCGSTARAGRTRTAPTTWACSSRAPTATARSWPRWCSRARSASPTTAGARAYAGASATAETVLDVHRNGSPIGTITFGTGASTGSFGTAGGGAETFAVGDRLAIINEDPADATLADLSITFLGKRT
jgi:hypothetical protein